MKFQFVMLKLLLLFVCVAKVAGLQVDCTSDGDCVTLDTAEEPVICGILPDEKSETNKPFEAFPISAERGTDAITSFFQASGKDGDAPHVVEGGRPLLKKRPVISRGRELPIARVVTEGEIYVIDTSNLAKRRPNVVCDPNVRACKPDEPLDYVSILLGTNKVKRPCPDALGKVKCETKAYKKRCKMYCPVNRN